MKIQDDYELALQKSSSVKQVAEILKECKWSRGAGTSITTKFRLADKQGEFIQSMIEENNWLSFKSIRDDIVLCLNYEYHHMHKVKSSCGKYQQGIPFDHYHLNKTLNSLSEKWVAECLSGIPTYIG